MITLDVKQIKEVEAALSHIPGAIPKAVAMVLNRATETVKTEAARKVRATYVVKNSDILSTMKITKAFPSSLIARVTSTSGSMPLIKFKVTPNVPQPQRTKPIIVRVKKSGGGPVTRAFVAQMGSGHLGVYMRAGKARSPIEQLYGPSIPAMIGARSVTEWAEQKALEVIDKRLDHEINRILEADK